MCSHARKKRKLKKRFNIGSKKKGSSAAHSAYYYDGGVPSDKLVKYIEGTKTLHVDEVFDGELTSSMAKEIDSNLYSNTTTNVNIEEDDELGKEFESEP